MISRFGVVIIFLLAGWSCGPVKKSPLKTENTGSDIVFDLEGHRGCRGLLPENTIPAFLKAMEIGVSTLEMDAVITADQQVILSHEPFFNHEITTKPNGEPIDKSEEELLNIYRMTYQQTLGFDVGLRKHPRFPDQQKMAVHKPLLADVIDSVKAWCLRNNKPLPWFNIETKSKPSTDTIFHPGPGQFVEILLKVIREKGIEKQVIIQSFDFRTLQYLHQHFPSIKTSALIEDYDHQGLEEQVSKLGFIPDFYSPAWELVTVELVQQCHQKKIKLIPWTINDKPAMIRLMKMGVDGLITDYPDRFQSIR